MAKRRITDVQTSRTVRFKLIINKKEQRAHWLHAQGSPARELYAHGSRTHGLRAHGYKSFLKPSYLNFDYRKLQF